LRVTERKGKVGREPQGKLITGQEKEEENFYYERGESKDSAGTCWYKKSKRPTELEDKSWGEEGQPMRRKEKRELMGLGTVKIEGGRKEI